MSEATQRILIAGVVAVVLIAGSVAAIALSDDSDSEPEQPLVALADEDQEETSKLDELFEGLFEGFLGDGGSSSEIPDRVLDLLDLLRSDLIAPDRDDF